MTSRPILSRANNGKKVIFFQTIEFVEFDGN